MAKKNAIGSDYTNNADGWDMSGGTTARKLTVTGGDISIAGSGSAVTTFPSSSDTLVGRSTTDTLTNKTISDASNTLSIEGTTIKSTGEAGGTKFLREDGDGTCSWQTPAGGAWTLVSYSTATGATSITVSSLDLSTDLYYDIVCEITGGSGARDENYITINGASSGYAYLNRYTTFNGNATAAANNLYSASNTQFSVGDGVNAVTNATFHVRVSFMNLSGTLRPFLRWSRYGAAGSDAEMLVMVEGTGYNNAQTNLTSIKFEPGASTTANYKVWVRKANTS